MARRMRAFDWAGTPLGPPQAWPSNLQAAVSIGLLSCVPIKIWWGPELIMLYNDAYIPSLGPLKHPAALGRSAWVVWPEIWDLLGPLIERSMTTGEATWSPNVPLFVDRELPKEEAFVDVSFSPIPGPEEGDAPGGVFCACMETTEKILFSRRLDTLRELRLKSALARPTGETCRLCAEALGENPRDVPFAAIYTLDEGGTSARLAASAGLHPEGWQPPSRVDARDPGPTPWPPLLSTLRSGRAGAVAALEAPEAALPQDPWSDPVRRAWVLPIRGPDQLAGLLVAGISPRRPLDGAYREFLEQVADQLASALAGSLAFEAERKRIEALAELDRAKVAFFTNISHEFRTPLTLMLGPLEEALRVTPEPSPWLATAHRNGLRLLKLVDALMHFSRLEAGGAQGWYQATDLPAYTAELASLFRSAVEQAGLRLELHCPPLPGALYVDRGMWEKVVFNLVSNALKHTFEGVIEVSLLPAGPGWAELRVRDTGIGIPCAELPQIFERFHRVRGAQARTHEGTGLGLALVKDLVKLHGGSIQVESVEGQGTCFTVRLPTGMGHLPPDQLVAGSASALPSAEAELFVHEALRWLPEPPASQEAASPLAGEARPRILVVDDNADMRDYLRRLLAESYEVAAAPDGEAALAMALERRPDLVLTDVMMPRMDGFALLARLRSDPRTRTLPIILISARAGEEARVDGVTLGADDYLVKPFTARELRARVASHLALARLRGELERELRRNREEVELQVSQRTLELRESEARLQGFIRHSPAAIAIQGADGRYLLVNPRMEAVLGRTALEILGRTSEDLLPEGRRVHARERERRVLSLGQEVQTEEQWTHGDGSTHDHLINAFPLVDATGQNWGLGLVAYDVTERKQESRALLQSQKLESLGVLAGGIAHDFNNLLGAMQGNVELAMAETSLEEAKPYLETLLGLMAKGSGLLRQMLAYAGRGKSSKRPLDLNLLVEEMAQLLETSIAKKARLHLDLHPHLPLLEGDPAQLQQVVMNLVLNASEALGDANGVITVSTFLEDLDQSAIDALPGAQALRPGSHAGLEVTDTGAGMAPAVMKQIFDPFFTTKLTGRGLGLAAIHGILRGHQGAIQVASEPGLGSTFKLWFPALLAGSVPAAPEAPLARPAGTAKTGCTLLVVDDEDEMRSVVVVALERAGFRILQARDGLEALNLYEAHRERIRLIILDLTMPNLDGEEVCRELRRRGAVVPVVLSSGFNQTEALRRLDGLGVAGFLQKPFQLGALVEQVQTVLEEA